MMMMEHILLNERNVSSPEDTKDVLDLGMRMKGDDDENSVQDSPESSSCKDQVTTWASFNHYMHLTWKKFAEKVRFRIASCAVHCYMNHQAICLAGRH